MNKSFRLVLKIESIELNFELEWSIAYILTSFSQKKWLYDLKNLKYSIRVIMDHTFGTSMCFCVLFEAWELQFQLQLDWKE